MQLRHVSFLHILNTPVYGGLVYTELGCNRMLCYWTRQIEAHDRLIELAELSGWSRLNSDEIKTVEHYFPCILD